MTSQITIEAAEKKAALRKAQAKKASSRLRQLQRKEQSKRQEKIGALVEASLGKKLDREDEQGLALTLALAAGVPMTLLEVLGGLVVVGDKLNGPGADEGRQQLQAKARAYLGAL